MPRSVERDPFDVAVDLGFHLDELGVHVIGRGLAHRRQGVGGDPLPGRDADINTLFQGLVAQVFSPAPGQQVNLDGVAKRVDAHFAVTPKRKGPDVAMPRLVQADEFDHGLLEVLARVLELHAVYLAGINQPFGVVFEAENGRALRRLVATDSLKQAGGVTDHVGSDMDRRLLPGNEFSVVPDFLVVCDRHSPCSQCPLPTARLTRS